jgi:hypothetical protein
MAGAGGQTTMIVPSHDLVVVRLGHYRGETAGAGALSVWGDSTKASIGGSEAEAPAQF